MLRAARGSKEQILYAELRSVHSTRKRQNFVLSVGRGKATTCGSLVGANELTVTQLLWLSEVIS